MSPTHSNIQRRKFLLKVVGLLSLIRWQNITVTLIGQYLAAFFVFNHGASKWDVLRNIDVHLIVLATAFIIAGGYIINAFYDFEKDLINRPSKTVFDRLISKSFALRSYFLLTAVGILVSALVTFNVMLYFAVFSMMLWYYSHRLQKITFLRELVGSLLSVVSVLSIALYFHSVANLNMVLIYAAVIMNLLFIRELVKDIIGVKGDMVFGYQTITVRFGLDATRIFVHLTSFFFVVLLGILIYASDLRFLWFSCAQLALVLFVNGLIRSGKQKRWELAHHAIRVSILLALIFIVFV